MKHVTVTHIDTCMVCYLTDRHERPGELLLGIEVDGNTRLQAVRDELKAAIDDANWDLPDDFDYEQFSRAVDEECSGNGLFDGSLEIEAEDDGSERVQAWFLVKYGDEEVEDEPRVTVTSVVDPLNFPKPSGR